MFILPLEVGDRVELERGKDDITMTTEYIRFEVMKIDRSPNEVTVKHFGQIDETETARMGELNRIILEYDSIEIERQT